MKLNKTRREFLQSVSALAATQALAAETTSGKLTTICGSGEKGMASEGDPAATARLVTVTCGACARARWRPGGRRETARMIPANRTAIATSTLAQRRVGGLKRE